MHDLLIGPYLSPRRLSAQIYQVFVAEKLAEMMEEILLALSGNMWSQHDRAAVHFARQVWEHLIATYNDHWIRQGGPVAWPPRSQNITPTNFFMCDHINALIVMSPVDSKEDFIAHIFKAAATTRKKHLAFLSLINLCSVVVGCVSRLEVVSLNICCKLVWNTTFLQNTSVVLLDFRS